ncbi:hypothetical protein LAD67_17335 [Escherichia coli]|nr:hypothetical protein [Escherichia coli]
MIRRLVAMLVGLGVGCQRLRSGVVFVVSGIGGLARLAREFWFCEVMRVDAVLVAAGGLVGILWLAAPFGLSGVLSVRRWASRVGALEITGKGTGS